ncbi:MAG: GNAT family N-acetyltransferase [Pseudomonadota bacterium]
MGHLGRGDAVHMHRLQTDAFETAWSVDSLQALLGQAAVFGIGLWPEKRGAGDALLAALCAQIAGEDAELLLLATAPLHQRRGYARRLLWEATQEASARGAARWILDVAADNEPAQALYQSLGFTIDGRRRAYYARRDSPRADALLMSCAMSGLQG